MKISDKIANQMPVLTA